MSDFIGKTWDDCVNRGLHCSLWGRTASEMSRDELCGFIGYLDSLIEHERSERKLADARPKAETPA